MKKSNFKKLLALLLVAAMAVSMLSVTAFAENETEQQPSAQLVDADKASEESGSGEESDKGGEPSGSGEEGGKTGELSGSDEEGNKTEDLSGNGEEGDKTDDPSDSVDEGDPTPAPLSDNWTELYVSTDGSDENSGTQAAPLASLAKAAELINAAEGTDYTVYVMTDLTSTACARFYNKNVTITSYGEKHTVSRGDGFATIADNARSFYNPAMVEIQGRQDTPALTLRNIVFDDCGKHMGSVYAQAISGEDHGDNLQYVQDAIIASNATVPCTINIEGDAALVNFGGMSAVRVTSAAHVNMNGTITGHTMPSSIGGGNGPAGAIWIQGGSAYVGGTITGLTGRAVYVDGGSATVAGTISNITPSTKMWQGEEGTAAHVRGNGTFTLNGIAEGNADKPSAYGTAFKVDSSAENALLVNKGAVIKDFARALQKGNSGSAYINGEITNVIGWSVLNLQGGSCTVGPDADIHHTTSSRATIYFQTNKLYLYGKLRDNIITDSNCSCVEINNNTYGECFMYPGAEVVNNNSRGLYGCAVRVTNGVLTMNGGTIANNSGMSGAVYVLRGGTLIMKDGQITGSTYGVTYNADDARSAFVQLLDGEISGNKTADIYIKKLEYFNKPVTYSNINRYLVVDGAKIGNPQIKFAKNSFDILCPDTTKVGNTSAACDTAINNAANARGWGNLYLSFWYQSDSSVNMTAVKRISKANLPVYVVAIPTDANGAPSGAPEFYSATVDGNNASFTLPKGNVNGYAVGLVQPTEDYGTLAATATESIQKIRGGSTYISNWGLDYSISDNLASVIEQADGKDVSLSLTVNLDSRLGNPENITLDSGIFEIDGEPVVDADAKTVVVNLKLKSGWKDNLADATCVLSGAAELNDANEDLAYTLNTSGTVSGSVGSVPVFVPSNVFNTRVLAVRSVTLSFDANGGSNAPDAITQYVGADGYTTFTIPTAAPTNGGRVFEGWSVTATGAAEYGAGHASTIRANADATLYAVWHTHVFGAWTGDANNHWRVCPYDGAVTDIGGHTYGDWTVTTAPTTEATGAQQHICTVCGHVETMVLDRIPAIAAIPGVPAPVAPYTPETIDAPETPLADEQVEDIDDEITPQSEGHGLGCIIHWIILAAALVLLVVYIVSAENEKKKIKALKEQLGL